MPKLYVIKKYKNIYLSLLPYIQTEKIGKMYP